MSNEDHNISRFWLSLKCTQIKNKGCPNLTISQVNTLYFNISCALLKMFLKRKFFLPFIQKTDFRNEKWGTELIGFHFLSATALSYDKREYFVRNKQNREDNCYSNDDDVQKIILDQRLMSTIWIHCWKLPEPSSKLHVLYQCFFGICRLVVEHFS